MFKRGSMLYGQTGVGEVSTFTRDPRMFNTSGDAAGQGQVYLVWRDYGFGDTLLVSAHKTYAGARAKVKEEFDEAAEKQRFPEWMAARSGEAFKANDGEVYITKMRLED
jgi:hypothetical protein